MRERGRERLVKRSSLHLWIAIRTPIPSHYTNLLYYQWITGIIESLVANPFIKAEFS